MVDYNIPFEDFTLDNGFKVGLVRTDTKTVSSRLLVHHGSLNELPSEKGIAHFLEHNLMSGGSLKYDSHDIKSNILKENLGYYNAGTSNTEIIFFADFLPEDLDMFMDYASDTFFHPKFDEEYLEIERGRVLQEINDEKSESAFHGIDEFRETLFGKGSPFLNQPLGDENVIQNASREDLFAYHERGFHANNMNLIIVGGFEKDAKDIIKNYFSDKPKGDGKPPFLGRNKIIDKHKFVYENTPAYLNQNNPEESSALIALGFNAPTILEKDHYATLLMNDLLGGGYPTELHRVLSEEKGLCYSISSDYLHDSNMGQIKIKGLIKAFHKDEAIEGIFEAINSVQLEPLHPEQLRLFQKRRKFDLIKKFESNEGLMEAIELEWETGITPQDHIEGIYSITSEDIMRVANKFLPKKPTDENYVMLLLDPLKDM